MNKRQRKKAGLRARPSRSSRRKYNRYVAQLKQSISTELDYAILELTIEEIQNQDLSRLNYVVDRASMSIPPVINPYDPYWISTITITKRIPGTTQDINMSLAV